MIPLMGVCYMMQFMDKLALSQATMFNLREDLVRWPCSHAVIERDERKLRTIRISRVSSTAGHLPFSILATSLGVPSART